jgi:hypothetical protein
MLQYMENIEASYIFYIKVGRLTHLEQSKTFILTVSKMGIVSLTVQHNFIVSVSFLCYPGDNLRQTSADARSLKHCLVDS